MEGKHNWATVPMRWFNSLPINNAYSKSGDWIFNHNMSDALFDKGTHEVYRDGRDWTVQPWKVMQGDMMLHFAGTDPVRNSWMEPWLNRTAQYLPEWSNTTRQVTLKMEAEDFWRDLAGKRGRQMDRDRIEYLHGSQAAMHAVQATEEPMPRPSARLRAVAAEEAPVAATQELKLQPEIVRMTGTPQLLVPSQSAIKDRKKSISAAPRRFTIGQGHMKKP